MAPTVGTDMRAARAFEAVVASDKSADRPAMMTTWYSAGKRHLHQPQLESLAELIAPMVAAAEPPPTTDPRKADGSEAPGGAGRGAALGSARKDGRQVRSDERRYDD